MRPIIQTKKQTRSGAKIFFVFALLLIVFFSISPRSFVEVSSRLNTAALPFWRSADSIASGAAVLRSRTELAKENEELRQKVDMLARELKGYDFVVQENLELKELFAARKDGGIFASVLLHPGHLPFDVFLLGSGSVSGIVNGDLAFIDQNTALGKVFETYPYSAKVKAFSSPGEVIDVFIGPENVPAQLKGAGGSSFTAELPRDLDVREGDAAVLPGSDGFIAAFVEAKEENLADSFQKLYLQSPANVFELKYVQILPRASSGNE
ncbi:MAG: rod shape-determining protein MreC [Parcubacteria group bacterium]|nr:rod shape-determining protein MreC [Parcubacteria group bacterium]